MMIEKKIKIPAKDGYMLSATLREPKANRQGVVQLHCGTGIPQILYANLARHLTENGYVTITFDYRGIGKSKPITLKGFETKMSDWGKLDMVGIFNWVIDKYPNEKKIIIGHSMGGQLVGLMENNDKIDQLFLIACSTGYWRDMSSPFKWFLLPVWFLLVPLHTSIYGYVNAGKIRQGENLPKGVALEWRKWCINPKYFEPEFEKKLKPVYFDQLKAPIKSIQISDDPIANHITINKMLGFYQNSTISTEKITPREMGMKKIGHAGYFSRKFKETLWPKLVKEII